MAILNNARVNLSIWHLRSFEEGMIRKLLFFFFFFWTQIDRKRQKPPLNSEFPRPEENAKQLARFHSFLT